MKNLKAPSKKVEKPNYADNEKILQNRLEMAQALLTEPEFKKAACFAIQHGFEINNCHYNGFIKLRKYYGLENEKSIELQVYDQNIKEKVNSVSFWERHDNKHLGHNQGSWSYEGGKEFENLDKALDFLFNFKAEGYTL